MVFNYGGSTTLRCLHTKWTFINIHTYTCIYTQTHTHAYCCQGRMARDEAQEIHTKHGRETSSIPDTSKTKERWADGCGDVSWVEVAEGRVQWPVWNLWVLLLRCQMVAWPAVTHGQRPHKVPLLSAFRLPAPRHAVTPPRHCTCTGHLHLQGCS